MSETAQLRQSGRKSFHRCRQKPICEHPNCRNGSVPAQRTPPPNAANAKHDSAQRKDGPPSKYSKQRWIVIRKVMELSDYDCRNGEHGGSRGKNKTNQREDRWHRSQFWFRLPSCPAPDQHYRGPEKAKGEHNPEDHFGERTHDSVVDQPTGAIKVRVTPVRISLI